MCAASKRSHENTSAGSIVNVRPRMIIIPTPAQHMMVAAGDARDTLDFSGLEMSLDYFGVACHGAAISHIDALCHVFVRGKMYNGFDASDVKSIGALRNAIDSAAADGIVGRGVLLDILV